MGDRDGTDAGLCGHCRHMRRVRSARGSTFHLCRRSCEDASFPRYPRLPVATCPGFEAAPAAGVKAPG